MRNPSEFAFALGLIDLTSLNDADTVADIRQLARDAVTPLGTVAALCVFPRFVATAKAELAVLSPGVRVATVANFPHGEDDADGAAREVAAAVAAGADEVDVVLPWRALQSGNETAGRDLVAACRAAVGDRILKVIIESGCLGTPALIRRASELAIEGGAHFLKTSTGKVAVNATLEAAEIMLRAIRESGRTVGFKAAGGIRTATEASAYLDLARRLMGADWVQPANFRFGASSLRQELLFEAGLGAQHASATSY
ncbi:deoxyribose-phosphate aldolase [Variovorax rhizosphaerae]